MRQTGIAEDLFGKKEPKKVTGGVGLIEDDDIKEVDPVDEEEAKKKKALKRKKKLLSAAAKW